MLHDVDFSQAVAWTGSRYINVDEPDPADFDLSEIATALSRIRRYNGLGTRLPWTVGQHTLLCYRFALSDGMDQNTALLTLLLHDAPEAYLGDMIHPVKQGDHIYKDREARFWAAMSMRWGLPLVMPDRVHYYDRLALATEKAALISDLAGDWPGLPSPREMPDDLLGSSDEAIRGELLAAFVKRIH